MVVVYANELVCQEGGRVPLGRITNVDACR